MQPRPPAYLKPQAPNEYGYNLGNINFSGLGAGINDQVAKLSNLLKARGKMFIPGLASSSAPGIMNYDYDGDGSIVKYTRQQFDDLYKTNIRRGSNYGDSGGDGYFDKLFFMFQLYIAFINALMNAANMSASIIFGNRSLQNIFSIFLVNVLNMILKTNVTDLTPEQLRDLLEKNRPVLQQISTIIIDEASQLLVGLSDVCKKIAMDWVQNVLPGLVKSAAIGVPSAVEAAIPPLGEVVEIVNTGLSLMGSFMKIVGAVQRNVDNVSQGVSHVKSAYDSLQKVKDLLSKDPSEIVKTATSAVVTPALNDAAQSFIQSVSQPAATATTTSSPVSSITPASASSPPSPPDPSHMTNLFNIGKNVVQNAARNVAREGLSRVSNAVSNLLMTPSGSAVTDSKGEPITKSFWENSWKMLFDSALDKLKKSKEAMNQIRLNSGIGENGKPLATTIIVEYIFKHPDILIPFLPVPYNVAAIAVRLVQTYIERVRQQKAAAVASTGGGGIGDHGSGSSRRTRTSKMKHRKYLKNTKHFHRYISNLRKKTAKKELELVNSIQELKNM
jgi:hypothetical protein